MGFLRQLYCLFVYNFMPGASDCLRLDSGGVKNLPHNKKKSFIRSNPLAYIVVPLALATVTAALLAALSFALLQPYQMMLGWFFDNTTSSQPQDLLAEAGTVIDGGTAAEAAAQPESIPFSSITYPTAGDRYGSITISGTNVDAPVYYGDTTRILNQGVGTYMENSGAGLPGEGKTILLAGHNNTFFNDLQHVEEGAVVTIATHYGVYTYEVTGTKILDYQDTSAYDFSREDENLILYTCYPFDALGFTSDRFFVYARYISGPVLDRNS